MNVTTRDRARLRAETLCANDTIGRWLNGKPVRPATHERLAEAAQKLGICVPDGLRQGLESQ